MTPNDMSFQMQLSRWICFTTLECMEFLTSKSNMEMILKDSFIRANLDSIVKMATSDDVVRLFDKLKDGSSNKSTWGSMIMDHYWIVSGQ